MKEFLVPADYKTAKNTLYKARNLCYWQAKSGFGTDCDRKRSWILSMGKQALVERSCVMSFIQKVLSNKRHSEIGFALCPSNFDVKTGKVSFLAKCYIARMVGHNYWTLKNHCDKNKDQSWPFPFHGGAYFVRPDVDDYVGNDWGSKASVCDDAAIGIAAGENQVISN